MLIVDSRTAFFDTATSLFIIPSSNCSSCTNLTLFDPGKSSTFSSLPGTDEHPIFTSGVDSIPLAQPEAPQCKSVHDDVSLSFGQLKVNKQSITLCYTYTDALEKSTISGIMGMGIGDPSLNDNSWFSNLVDGRQVDSAVFSFYIPPGNLAGGQVTLGGVDESKVDGDIRWTNLSADATPEIFTYVLDQSAIYAGGKIIYSNSTNGGNSTNGSEAFASYALLDTGTAFMQAPDFDTAKSIYAQISPDITQIDPAGAWGAPCDKMDSIAPDLTFTLGTNDEALNLTIPSKYFNIGEYPGHPGICQALFNNPTKGNEMALDGVGVWIAGSPLLNKYYTVWDIASLRIGWGKLAGQPGFDGHS